MMHLGDVKVRQRVVQRIALLKPDTPGQWGKMTAGQMLNHLNDSFNAAVGMRRVGGAPGLLERTLIKWAALYAPIRWTRGYPARSAVGQGDGGITPGDFASGRAALVSSLERFCDPNRAADKRPHPVFGPMTDRQWLRWGYLHTDRHLRQFGV